MIAPHDKPIDISARILSLVAPGKTGDVETIVEVNAANGTISLVAGVAIYTAPAGGADILNFTVEDRHLRTAGASIAVTVDPGPTAARGVLTLGHGQTQTITALLSGLVTPGLDADTETLIAVSATAGTVTLADGVVTYISPASGTAVISYTVRDQLGDTATGTVAVFVEATATVAEFLATRAALDQSPGGFRIVDSPANLTAAALDALNADSALRAIVLTGASAPLLRLSAAAALNDAMALSKIVGAYAVVVVDTAAHIRSLSPAQIDALRLARATGLEATDRGVTLTLAQKAALGAAGLTLQQPRSGGGLDTLSFKPDGGYDIRNDVPGTWWGLSYASSESDYKADGFRDAFTIYDASGAVLGSQTNSGDGGYSVTLGGAVRQVRTITADGYELRNYVPGTWWGLSYASSEGDYKADGFRDAFTIYDASGAVLGRQTNSADGGYSVTLGGALRQIKTVHGSGGYDIRNLLVTGQSYTSSEIDYDASGAKVAFAADYANGSGSLTLYGAGDVVTLGPGELSVAAGADRVLLTAHAQEAMNATGAAGSAFVFAPASGADQPPWSAVLSGFVATGADHETMAFAASALGAGLTAADPIADWQALVALMTQNSAGQAVIHDIYGDTLTLAGVSKATLSSPSNAGDFKFV